MGCWGYNSYESDHVMDLIDNEHDKIENTGKKWKGPVVNLALVRALNGVESYIKSWYKGDDDNKNECYVGIVMYGFIECKVKLPDIYLMKALSAAVKLLYDKGYLNTFKVPGKRRDALKKEIKIIQGCLDNPEEYKIQMAIGSLL